MSFSSQKTSKVYKTLIHTNLMMVEYGQNKIEFRLFNLSHEDIIKQTQLLNSDLQTSNLTEYDKSLLDVFNNINKNSEELIKISDNAMTLNVPLSKEESPLNFCLELKEMTLTTNECIFYMKEYIKCKDDFYKNEILKLKSKIYSLMTEVEDATILIRSQSAQAKSYKDQIKKLKKELQLIEEEKKKQEKTFLVDVGVQHSYSTQINDIIEYLERPELKQFNFDEEKLINLMHFIERQIKESEKNLITNESLSNKEREQRKYLSETNIPYFTEKPQEQFVQSLENISF